MMWMSGKAFLKLLLMLLVYIAIIMATSVVETLYMNTDFITILVASVLGMHILYLSGKSMKNKLMEMGVDERAWMRLVWRGVVYVGLTILIFEIDTRTFDTIIFPLAAGGMLGGHFLYEARKIIKF